MDKPLPQTPSMSDGSPASPGDNSTFDRLRASLSDSPLGRMTRKSSTFNSIIFATLGLLLTVFLVRRAGDLATLGDVLHRNQDRILGFFVFTNLYVLFKGLALRRAALSSKVSTSFWRATRTFCESSLVGLIVVKLASDVYKYTRIGDGSRNDKIRTIVVYRIASILAVLILSGAVSIMWAQTVSWTMGIAWLVPIAIITGLAFAFRNRVTTWLREHGRIITQILPYSLLALLAKIGGLAMLLGVSLDGELVQVAAAFLLIGSLASMSQVPAGVGLIDAGYAVFLTKYVGTTGAEAAAFLISFRLLGPMYVGALGGISLLANHASKFWQRDSIEQQPST